MSPAEYCKTCHFPFKQMGACPYPDKTIIWSYLSMVPYILPFLFLIYSLIFRRISKFKIFFLAATAYIIGDKILKKLIKNHRPQLSCKSSYGMPSSHMTVMTAMSIERIFDQEVHIAQKIVWILMTVAQGFARTELNYHTFAQVIAGVIFAIVYSLLFIKLWELYILPLINKYFGQQYSKPSDHESQS